jgi:hypothetical protein
MLRVALGAHAHVANELEHGGHVLQAGHVVQLHGLVGQQGRAQLGQGGVFGARDCDRAMQRAAAAYEQFVHGL